MSALKTHVSTLAPDFPEQDIDFTATLKDSTRDDAPGQVPADHGLQAGVEPARSHPFELAEYLSALRKCKNSSVRAMMRVWLENGGPLTTPVSQEIDQWDTFLGKSRELRRHFQNTCNRSKARVGAGFHEEDLEGGDEDDTDETVEKLSVGNSISRICVHFISKM